MDPTIDDPIKCPKCGSTQVTANKKGFSAGKAIGGAVLTGGIGVLAGLHGSGKIKITCLKCGNVFKPGALSEEEKKEAVEKKRLELLKQVEKTDKEFEKVNFKGCFFFIVIAIIIYALISLI